MNWHEACDQLQGLTPPEVTHYHENNHVGLGWYLHTVIPSHVDHVIHKTWQQLQSEHTLKIHIMPIAYDWHAQLIPHASSVWFQAPYYVHVTQLWPSCLCEIWSQDQAINYWGDQITKWAHAENIDPLHIHKLNSITHYMQSYTSTAQAVNRRKQFRVIQNDQKDSGPTNSGSNMDPD